MLINKRDNKGRILPGNNYSHGMSDLSIYDCWIAMKARCFKENHPMYKHYGGRGITVSDRWRNSFEDFVNDMGNKPSPEYTIDRIDVNGNYEPANCRWITIQEQQKNRRNNTSHVGVEYEKSRDKWRALISYKGQRKFLGRYNTLTEALEVRAKAENELWHTQVQQH